MNWDRLALPEGWADWLPYRRALWLRDGGHAPDLLAASRALEERGWWPSREELGFVGGRVVEPMPRHRRQVAPAPPSAPASAPVAKAARKRRVARTGPGWAEQYELLG